MQSTEKEQQSTRLADRMQELQRQVASSSEERARLQGLLVAAQEDAVRSRDEQNKVAAIAAKLESEIIALEKQIDASIDERGTPTRPPTTLH